LLYLHQIVKNTSDLHLYRMTRAQSGSGQSLLPPIKLADVYTNVVVDGDAVRLGERTRPANRARKLSERIKNYTGTVCEIFLLRSFDLYGWVLSGLG